MTVRRARIVGTDTVYIEYLLNQILKRINKQIDEWEFNTIKVNSLEANQMVWTDNNKTLVSKDTVDCGGASET